MTKNQILDMHAHTLRANFQQFMAAFTMVDPSSKAGDYLCNASSHAFDKLALFYNEHNGLFNEIEASYLDEALSIWDNAGEELTQEEADALTEVQCNLYDYYNDTLDEDGYHCD